MAKSFLILLVSLFTFSLFAQNQDKHDEPSLEKQVRACPKPKVNEVGPSAKKLLPDEYLERLEEIKKTLDFNGLSVGIKAGVDGNYAIRDVFSAAQNKQSLTSNKISLASRLAYGVYPTEAEFSSSLSFEYMKDEISQSNKFQETMSSFLFNVERYFSRRWEAYGFIERFSNSYMGVEQRWEMGCGFKWEVDLLSKKQEQQLCKLKCNRDIEIYLTKLLEILESKNENAEASAGNDFFRMAASLRKSCPHAETSSSLEKICYDLRTYRKWIELFEQEIEKEDKNNKNNTIDAWKKKQARFQFDLASSVFSETTHPSLTYTVLSQNAEREWLAPIAEKKQFDPESKLRLALRGGAVWRPSKNSEVTGKCYLKFPLSNAYVKFDDEKKYDLRIDAFGRIGYEIPLVPGSSKIVIGLQLDYFYDQITPFLDQKTREEIIKEKDSAEDMQKLGIKHYIYNFLGPKSFLSLKATVGWEM
jgi:hypothetical protein